MAQTASLGNINVVPSVNKTATTTNYVSSINLSKPEIHEELVGRFGNQRIADDLYFIFGDSMPTGNKKYTHYEEEWIHDNGTMQTATAPTSGQAETTFTVPAAFLNGGVTTLRAGDIIMFSVNKQIALVSATSAAAIAGSTVTAGANLVKLIPYKPWSFTSGSNATEIPFTIIGRENIEFGSAPTEFLSPKVYEYTNNLMILDDAYAASGSAHADQTWIRAKGVDGKEGWVWTYKGELDARNRFENYCELMKLVGTTTVASGTLEGRGFSGTRGYLTDLELNSGRFQADFSSATIDADDLRAMAKHLNKFRGARENAMYLGIDLYNKIEKAIALEQAAFSTGQNFGAFNNSVDTFVNLGFTAVGVSGYKFAFKAFDLFNHPKLLGTTGLNYSWWGFVMPLQGAPDPKTGVMLPPLRTRYRAMEGYSREMEHWLTGGANGVYTNTVDGVFYNYRAEVGFEASGLSRHFLWKSTN